ncbi:carbonic anhydrase [Pseudomonas fontis]|uniref:Carbonic anhydrase n=1 Tax=Pseudomonas fontis TaxID=2942633 RepID=A0ABT5NZ22_9PSED|nr:carbonic anhydrase [Pseudomonas fontis]MDD0977573.1 carbonic anhydrase [Pseudomonas fontis]MDD0993449.1 carbonic anhydrase [Pseudomonas fontis]
MCELKTEVTEVVPLSRRMFMCGTGVAAAALAVGGMLTSNLAVGAEVKVPPKPENILSPDQALKRLMEGNARYASGVMRRHDFASEQEQLIDGQNPYAAVLSCADSRVAPEYAFDTARGDLFVARVAGNLVNDDMLGSLEYAVAVLKVPMILVLGHDKCGAVGAAVDIATKGAVFPGKIQSLAAAMLPAVNKVKGSAVNLLDAAIVQNVRDGMSHLREQSAIIEHAEKTAKLKIVGGVYRLATGRVELLGLTG